MSLPVTTTAAPRPALALLALGVAASLGAAGPLAAQQHTRAKLPAVATEHVAGGRPLDRDGSVRVFVLNGRVRVTGWDRDSVAVTGSAAKGQDLFIGGGRRGIKLGLWDRAGNEDTLPSQLDVRVPAGSRVWVKTGYAADVDVTGVVGGLDLNTAGGTVRVTGSPRELTAEAMEGDVEITGSPAWLRAKSASGAITLRGSSEDATLSTVSGRIVVSGAPGAPASFSRARFESVTGNVSFSGVPARGGMLDFDTHSGTVDLAFPSTVGADFEVTTIAGTVENMLTGARPVADSRRKLLSFSTGGGGAHVTVRTFKGLVRLRHQ